MCQSQSTAEIFLVQTSGIFGRALKLNGDNVHNGPFLNFFEIVHLPVTSHKQEQITPTHID